MDEIKLKLKTEGGKTIVTDIESGRKLSNVSYAEIIYDPYDGFPTLSIKIQLDNAEFNQQ